MASGSCWPARHSGAHTVCSNPAMCSRQRSSAQYALQGSTVHPPSNGTGANPGSYPVFGNYQTGDLEKWKIKNEFISIPVLIWNNP